MGKKIERTYSGTKDGSVSARELKNRELARKAAAEGIVLLKNNGVLPLTAEKKAALCGVGAVNTIKGGTGSGDVNERETVSIYQGLLNAGVKLTNITWLENCKEIYAQARQEWKEDILRQVKECPEQGFFGAYSKTIFKVPSGDPLTKEVIADADTAIYVVSRTAGEDADRYEVRGDYYLTEREKEDLAFLSESNLSLIVLLNVGGPIDLKEILSVRNLQGLLMISQPGMEGGNAVADVLTGRQNPSGKLTDTWAVNYQDYPNSAFFSHNNGNVKKEYYEEGIYVGYRYFDTFDVKPAYSFGYGLSYTKFEISNAKVVAKGNRVDVSVHVKNIGNTAGREVVQIYVSCPQTGLTKEFRRLCGFQKTELINPDKEQAVTISFPIKALACFDQKNASWILEGGTYGIWVGGSLDELKIEGMLSVEDTAVIEKVTSICRVQDELKEREPNRENLLAKEKKWLNEAAQKGLKCVQLVPGVKEKERLAINKAAVLAEKITAKLTEQEKIAMCIGEVTKGQGSQLGSAGVMVPGAAGETCGLLEETYDIAGVSMADGPAGLRLVRQYEVDKETGQIYTEGMLSAVEGGLFASGERHENTELYYQYATAIPVGTLLAQTWDTELVSQAGKAVAVEMLEFGVSWWLAPGMNIHRNPLCGRNFEYYSEDPLISGSIAAAMTLGVQSAPGVGTTIKHFACNNQEDNRMGSDSIVSERALREIYLRGFELAVKNAQSMAIMTSYNLINGVHTANSHDLCTTLARDEWDFQGIIMTDWTTTFPRGGSLAWKCIEAGNDLIMPGCEGDKENIKAALESGELSKEALDTCVKRMLTLILQTSCYEDAASYSEQFCLG